MSDPNYADSDPYIDVGYTPRHPRMMQVQAAGCVMVDGRRVSVLTGVIVIHDGGRRADCALHLGAEALEISEVSA